MTRTHTVKLDRGEDSVKNGHTASHTHTHTHRAAPHPSPPMCSSFSGSEQLTGTGDAKTKVQTGQLPEEGLKFWEEGG